MTPADRALAARVASYMLAACVAIVIGVLVKVKILHGTPEPDVVTTCGLRVYGSTDVAGLNSAEASCLAAFEQVKPLEAQIGETAAVHVGLRWSRDLTCPALKSYALQVHPELDGGGWIDDRGQHVGGELFHGLAVLQIGQPPWRRTAFCHELAHVMEDKIDFLPPAPGRDHVAWPARGIQAAVDAGAAAQ